MLPSSSGSPRKNLGRTGTPLRLSVDAGPSWPAAEFDGALQGDPAAGLGGLRFAGAATLTGTAPGEDAPTPWRVAGPMTVDLDQASLRQAEFRLGPEERGIRADGDAKLVFGSPAQISVALRAKQVNVDSLMRRKGEDGVAPARAVTLITRIVSAALQGRESEAAIDAQVLAQPIILGAQTLPDASATLKTAPGAPLNLTFNLGLPGQSRLRADGDLETGAEAKFRGDVAFISADFALLRDWATLGAPPAAAKVAAFVDALPYRSASLSGAVEASPTGFSGRNLKLTLDRSTLTGAAGVQGARWRSSRPPRCGSRQRFARRRRAAEPRGRESDRRSRPLAFAEGGFAAYRPRRRSADRQRLVGAECGQERAERHAQAPERGRPGRGLFRCRGRDRSRLDCGDGSLASRPPARFRSAGFARSAERLEPDAGRAGG